MAIEGGRVRWVFEVDDSGVTSALDRIESRVEQTVNAINKAEKRGSSEAFSGLKESARETAAGLEDMEKAARNMRFTTLSSGASLASSALSNLSSSTSGVAANLADTQSALAGLSDSFAKSADSIAVASKYISGEQLAGSGIAKAFSTAQTEVQRFGDSVMNVAKQPISFIADTGGMENSLETISRSLVDVKDRATEVNTEFQNFAKSLGKSTFSAFTTLAGSATTALTGLAAKGIAGADSLETTRLAMAGLIGSLSAGNKAMATAAEFWQNNPFQRFDVSNATQQLVQFGRTTDQLKGDLQTLGNISLSTGVNIAELARYYARVSASGRAMTMDLEMMSDRGVPIYRELAKQLKTTTAGVRDMASQGKIDFETFKTAMENAVNPEAMKEYENTLARQKDRLSGSISMLAGDLAGYTVVNNELIISERGLEKAWTRLMQTLATGLRSEEMREGFTKLGFALANLVDKIIPYVEKGLSGLSKVISFVGDNSQLIIPILGGAAVMLGKLATNIPILSDGLKALTSGFSGMSGAVRSFVTNHKGLTIILGAIALALVQAYRSSEEFRTAVGNLLRALGKLATSLTPIITTLANVLANFLQSEAVTQVLIGITNALTGLAELLASFPQEQLVGIVSGIGMFALLKTHPIIGVATAIGTIVSILKQLHQNGVGVDEFVAAVKKNFTNLVDWLGQIPGTLVTIGGNIMVGLFNGLVTGGQKVIDYCAGVARGIIQIFQSVLQIHSPSRVFYRFGKYIALGLANGIADSKSAVQRAMDSLATATLDKAKKVIQNKYSFGVIDYAGEYRQWKKVAKLFKKGSEQYNAAIENMEEARKNANLQIIEITKDYNDTLDANIRKTKQMLSLFTKVDTGSAGMNATQVLRNLDKQVSKYQQWFDAQKKIATLGFSDELVKELQDMGVEAADELAAIANMTESELQTFKDLWSKKNLLGQKGGELISRDEQKEALDSIKKITDGIDGETVKVKKVGARLTYSLSDGITGALPTLKDAYKEWDKYLQAAKRDLAKSGSKSKKASAETGLTPQVPELGANTPLTKDFDFGQTEASFKLSTEQLTQNLISILGKVILAIAAWKFGPKLLQALGSTSLGSKLTGFFSGLFGKKAVQASVDSLGESGAIGKNVSKIASNTEVMGSGVQTVSSGVQKAINFRKVIEQGCIAVGEIALAILAAAVAVRASYELVKDVDWAGFGKTCVMIGIAVAEMGALATACSFIQKIGLDMKTGLLLVAGIAGDLFITAVALEKLDKGITSSFGTMAAKIGVMGLAILAIGGLSTALGALMTVFPMVLAGLAGVVAISGSLILAAESIKQIDEKVPADISGVVNKVKNIVKVVDEIAGVQVGNFFKNIAATVNMIAVPGLVMAYAAVAAALQAIQNINIDGEKVVSKIKYIKEVVESIAGESIVKSWRSMVSTFYEMMKSVEVAVIVNVYYDMATKLEKIQNIRLDQKKVVEKVNLLKDVVTTIGGTGTNSILLQIRSAVSTFMEVVKTFSVNAIVSIYEDMANKLNRIQTVKLDKNAINDKINLMGDVVETISSPATRKGFFFQLADTIKTAEQLSITDNSSKILQIFTEMVEPLDRISNLDIDEGRVNEKLDQMSRVVKKISSMKGHGGAFALIADFYTGSPLSAEQARGVLEIIRRLSDIANTINYMPNVDTGHAERKIDEISRVISKLDGVKLGSDVSNANWAWGEFSSLINRFTEVAKTISALPEVRDKSRAIETVRKTVEEIIKINTDVGDIGAKNEIVNKAKEIATNLVALAQQVAKLKSVDGKQVEAVKNLRNVVWEVSQINEDVGDIEAKKNIVESTVSVAKSMKSLAGIMPALVKSDSSVWKTTIQGYRDAIWEICQINENVGDIHGKEEIVSIAVSISRKFTELQNVYKKLTALDITVAKSFRSGIDEILNIQEDYGDTHKKEENVSIATSIAMKLKEFYNALSKLKNAGKMNDIIKSLLNAVNTTLTSVKENVQENLDKFISVGKAIAEKVAEGAQNGKAKAAEAGHAIQTAMWEAIQKRLPDMQKQGTALGNNVVSGIKAKSVSDAAKSAGNSIVSALASGANNKENKEKAKGAGTSIANNLVSGLKIHNGKSKGHGNYDAGINAIAGFLAGANAAKNGSYTGYGGVYRVGFSIASTFLQGLKDGGKQGSPWKTTRQSGIWAVEGLMEGLMSQESALEREAKRIAQGVVSALSADGAMITPTIATSGLATSSTPRMEVASGDYSSSASRANTVINQYNNMYSDYDKDKIINDLSWALGTR